MRRNEMSAEIPLLLVEQARRGSKSYHVIEEETFKRIMEVEKLSRKKCKETYNISPHLFSKSLNYWYTDSEVEALRRKKIMGTLVGIRPVRWRERAQIIEKFIPGLISDIEKAKYKSAVKKLEQANDLTYELKDAVRLVHKHLRRPSKAHNVKINFVANALEYKVKKIIKSLNLKYTTQFSLEDKFYDFKIKGHRVLIEVDGKQHHTKESNIPKNKLAKHHNYILVRIKEKEVKNVHYIKDKINKALGQKISL